jgi:phage N-6-adenine-methyltransferase
LLKNSLPSALGQQLRDARKRQKQNQQHLADAASLSVPTVRLLERGQGYLTSFDAVLAVLNLTLAGRNLPQGETIGGQIALLRKRRSLGQRELAGLVGVSQPTIINLERHSRGKLNVLESVLTVLGAGAYLAGQDDAKAFYSHAGTSSGQNGWTTPLWLLDKLYPIFGTFDLDPCSPTHNRKTAPVKARVYYTEADNGLTLPWAGTVFVNPPYGRGLKDWIAKCHHEATCGNVQTIIALIPARTDTSYWHQHVAGRAAILFLRGRLSFGNTGDAAPFPSALVLWGSSVEQQRAMSEAFPDAWLSPCGA